MRINLNFNSILEPKKVKLSRPRRLTLVWSRDELISGERRQSPKILQHESHKPEATFFKLQMF